MVTGRAPGSIQGNTCAGNEGCSALQSVQVNGRLQGLGTDKEVLDSIQSASSNNVSRISITYFAVYSEAFFSKLKKREKNLLKDFFF